MKNDPIVPIQRISTMRKRLFWILMTYVERPLFWLLSLAALGVWLYFLPTGAKQYSTCHPQLTLRRGAVFDLNSLETLRREGRASDVTDVTFDRLWNDAFHVAIQTPSPGERPPGIEGTQQAAAERLAELADLPNLERVTFTHRNVMITGNGRPIQPGLPMHTLGRLAQIHDLALSFLGTEDVPENVLQPLANLRELRALQLEYFESLPSFEVLADLPHLETLILVQCDGLTPQRFAEISQLKQLKTLVLPDVSRLESRDASLTRLQKIPGLATIYVAGMPQDDATLEAVRTAVPEARVLRGWYNSRRVGAFMAGMYLLLFLGLGSFQLTGQFSMPQSRLIPGFARPHAVVATGLIVTVIAVHSLLLWGHGADLWPAMAATGTIFVLSLSLWTHTNAHPRRKVQNGKTSDAGQTGWLSSIMGVISGIALALSGIGLAMGVGLLISNAAAIAPYIERFLLGEAGMLPAALLLVTFGLVVVLVVRLATLQTTRAEAGLPVELAFSDWQSRHQTTIDDGNRQQVFLLRGQDRVLRKAITRHGANTRWHRVQRWRAGITTRLNWMIFGMLVVFALPWWAYWEFTGGLTREKALGMAGMLYVICTVMVAGQWWQGYGHLRTALQWPLSRRTLVGDVFAAVALDLLFPAPLVALSIAGYLSGVGGISLLTGLATLLGSLGVVALCYAGSLWFITVRNVWSVILFTAALYGFGSMILILALVDSTNGTGPPAPTPFRIAAVGGLAIAIAGVLVAFAFHRWMRLEFGKEY